MRNILFLGISLLLLLSCSKGSKSSATSPLSADQKNKFSSVMDSFGRSIAGVEAAKKRTLTSDSLEADPMQTQMAEKLIKNECTLKYELSGLEAPKVETYRPQLDIKVDIGVKGSRCPIELQMGINFNSLHQPKGDIYSSLFANGKYTVNDQAYRSLNDISAFDFKGGGGISYTVDETRNETKQNVDISISGDLLSQRYGGALFELTGRGKINTDTSGANGEVILSLVMKFNDCTVELKRTDVYENAQNPNDRHRFYSLNGESITPAEFNGYLSKATSGKVGKKSIFALLTE